MNLLSFLRDDSAAGLLVTGMICMTRAEIMGEAVKYLTDTVDQELVDRVRNYMVSEVERSENILEITRVRARWIGSKAVVDLVLTTKNLLSSSTIRAIEGEHVVRRVSVSRVTFHLLSYSAAVTNTRLTFDIRCTSHPSSRLHPSDPAGNFFCPI